MIVHPICMRVFVSGPVCWCVYVTRNSTIFKYYVVAADHIYTQLEALHFYKLIDFYINFGCC